MGMWCTISLFGNSSNNVKRIVCIHIVFKWLYDYDKCFSLNLFLFIWLFSLFLLANFVWKLDQWNWEYLSKIVRPIRLPVVCSGTIFAYNRVSGVQTKFIDHSNARCSISRVLSPYWNQYNMQYAYSLKTIN